jgi:hypothetical protein
MNSTHTSQEFGPHSVMQISKSIDYDDDMKIDVLLPFHIDNLYLHECLSSLESSNGVSIRLLLIDDRKNQSSDIDIKGRVFKDLLYLKTGGGIGYGRSLQLGSAFIESDQVALMNSDDIIQPDRFLKQISMLEDSELSIAKMIRIDARGRKIPSITGEIHSKNYDPLFLILGAYGANASWCMRREWWTKNAIFDSNECLDWRIALSSFVESRISYTEEPLYFYRKHSSQVTSNRSISREKMSTVYKSWSAFSKSYNLPEVSYSVFNLVATPWNSKEASVGADFHEFDLSLRRTIRQLEPEIRTSFLEILARRNFFAMRSTKKSGDLKKLIGKSICEIPMIGRDVIHSKTLQLSEKS